MPEQTLSLEENHQEKMPASEKLRSHHYQVAEKMVRKQIKSPAEQERLLDVLGHIDDQVQENFFQFTPSDFPGVRIPCSDISINKLVQDCFPDQMRSVPADRQNGKKTMHVILGTHVFPPDGDPTTHLDMIQRAAVRHMPEIVNAARRGEPIPEIRMIIPGNPIGEVGGEVTPEWLKSLKENGFDTYGESYAELLRETFLQPGDLTYIKNSRWILEGISMGALNAKALEKALKEKDPQLQEDIQLLLDNPVDIKKDTNKLLKLAQKVQVGVGFVAEGIRLSTTQGFKDTKVATPAFRSAFMRKLGLSEETKEQQALKSQCAWADIGNILKGTDLTTEANTYIRRGTRDPLTWSPSRMIKTMAQQSRSRGERPHLAIIGNIKEGNREFPVNIPHLHAFRPIESMNNIVNQIAHGKRAA